MNYLQPNTTLQGGKYKIERVLGHGGFGITYLAEHVSAHKRVAIKELFIANQGQAINGRNGNKVTVTNVSNQVVFDKHREKLKKEASRLAMLRHENLVRVYEWFEENGTVYYVMDFIEGESLRDKLNREGALPESLVMNYLQQLLSALQVVHEKNIWHLDIKPENIMVNHNNHIYLIDFGASKHIEQSNGTLTTSSMLAYTPGYFPPEQSAVTMRNIGAWTDIYALGATLYNLLTRRNPPTFDVIISEGRYAFSFPSSISSQTQDLIVRMMKVNRNERPQSVQNIIKVFDNNEKVKVDIREKRTPYPKERKHEVHNKKEKTSATPMIVIAVLILGSFLGYHLYQKMKTQIIIDNIVNNMVYVTGGTFKMGHDDINIKPTDSYNGPVHIVTLSPFYIGKYEVTQEEWERVMGFNPSLHIGAKLPVERVTWAEAKQFVEKLSSMSGKTFRLPTEAEWEYAARGGNKSNNYLFSGSNNYDDVAWCKNNSREETHEVGMKRPNELGIYDMSGNVIEWCQDYLVDYKASSQQDPLCSEYDPQAEFIPVVCRGGCVESNPNGCRVFERESRWTDSGIYQRYYVGLRIVCTKM